MMDQSEEPAIKRRPGTARSAVMEFNGLINPNPAVSEDSDLVKLHLSPEKLKSLSGSDDLHEVTSLEMCVDTRQDTLENFGTFLPKLAQLKMNNSLISSVRDLGTSLSHLQVLWLARCGLTDLEGIPSIFSLKELYVPYNNISDLSPVSMLEHLEILDLEGNDVEDLVQVQYLGFCGKLRTLFLQGNPVCTCPNTEASEVSQYSYRSAVRELIPQLSFLDDVPVENDEPQGSRTSLEDWTRLKESITDSSNNHNLDYTDTVCAIRPGSSQHLGLRTSPNSSRPATAGPLTVTTGSRPGSADSDLAILDQEASDLTLGVGRVLFCGNPLQAVRARRQKILLQNSHSQTRPSTQLGSYVPEHTYDHEECNSQDRSDVFAELRTWRIEHNKRLQAIEKDRVVQVMRILHSDEEDDDDYDEGSHNHSSVTDENSREEGEERERTIGSDATSPDSSFQSPDMFQQSSGSPLTSLSDCTMSPSPPSVTVSPPGGRIAQIRARRLIPHKSKMSIPSEETLVTDNGTTKTNTTLGPQSTLQTVTPQILHKPHRPTTSPVSPAHRAHRSEASRVHEHQDNKQKTYMDLKMSAKILSARPQTARAALQRLPDRTLLSAGGNVHLK